MILQLAFQSIGTSPLYVFAMTFTDGVEDDAEYSGGSFSHFCTLTLIPLFKDVFIVLKANDKN